MKNTSRHYECAVDLLVANSAGRFSTPYGIMSGKEILERIWFRHTPEKPVEADKLYSVQRKIWGESQARVLDNGCVEFKGDGGWYRIQFSLR